MNKREKQTKNNIKEAHIYFPAEVYDNLKEMAKKNRRTMNGEVIMAVEERIANNIENVATR